MVFTIGDVWDALGAAGGKVKKTVAERPKWIFEGWGVQPRAKGMTVEEVTYQEATVIGGYPRAALGGLWAGVTGKEPTTPTTTAPAPTTPTAPGSCWDPIYALTHRAECMEKLYGVVEQKGVETVGGAVPGWIQEPPGWWTTDPSKIIPGVDIDLSQLGVAEGMTAMGQALAAALAGMKPEITVPTGLTDEEGKIPPTVLIGAAVVGLGAIYLIGRK